MNYDTVKERLIGLMNAEAEALQQVEQAQAELYAIRGAKQDCEYWLQVMTPEVEGLPEGVEVEGVTYLDDHRD